MDNVAAKVATLKHVSICHLKYMLYMYMCIINGVRYRCQQFNSHHKQAEFENDHVPFFFMTIVIDLCVCTFTCVLLKAVTVCHGVHLKQSIL